MKKEDSKKNNATEPASENSAKEKTAEAAASVQEAGEAIKDEFEEKLKSMLGEFNETADEIKNLVEENIGDAEKLIRERPFLAVGVAAGVGLLAGLLLNRRG